MGFQKVLGSAKLFLRKHGPTIATGAGIVGVIASTVWSCKQTLKIEKIEHDYSDREEELNDKIERALRAVEEGKLDKEKYTEADAKKDLQILHGKKYLDIAKLYVFPGLLGAISIGLIVWGHASLLKDNAGLAATVTGLTEAFNEYRRRVRDDVGEEKDREYYTGVKTEERVIVDPDTGEPHVEKHQTIASDPCSVYVKEFREGNPNFNYKSHQQNLFFLKRAEQIFTDKLRARGYLFLNEVYEYLRLDLTFEGQHVGWVVGEKGVDYVDFGLKPYLDELHELGVYANDAPRTIRLDFNVDGDIMHIFKKSFGDEFAEKLVK